MNKTISSVALGVFAFVCVPFAHAETTSTSATLDTACIKTAIEARESSLKTGWSEFSAAVTGAYTTRAEDLATAYGKSTPEEIKGAVKNAWTIFKNTVKTARTEWKGVRKDTWAEFKNDKKECRVPKVLDDSTNQSSDVQ